MAQISADQAEFWTPGLFAFDVALVHLDVGKPIEEVTDAIRATRLERQADIEEVASEEESVRHALDLLGSERNDAYEAAVATLRGDPKVWWEETLARDSEDGQAQEKPATADPERLRRFLELEVLPWLQERKMALANRPLVREQAFGESLDPEKLERLSRYEVHLDRPGKRGRAVRHRGRSCQNGDAFGD